MPWEDLVHGNPVAPMATRTGATIGMHRTRCPQTQLERGSQDFPSSVVV